MDSNQKTIKRRIKICEDFNHRSVQVLHQPQILLDQIEEQIKISEEISQTNDTNVTKGDKNTRIDYKNNKYFEFQTKLNIDEKCLELRESLSQLSEEPNCDHYFELIKSLNETDYELDTKAKSLIKELFLWKIKFRSVEKEFSKKLNRVKRMYWCRVCRRRAVPPYQCCREGYYCGYTHFKGDRSHFIYCKLNQNRPNFNHLF